MITKIYKKGLRKNVYYGLSDTPGEGTVDVLAEGTVLNVQNNDEIFIGWGDLADTLGTSSSKFLWVAFPNSNPDFLDYNKYLEEDLYGVGGGGGSFRDITNDFTITSDKDVGGESYRFYIWTGTIWIPDYGLEGVNPINMYFKYYLLSPTT